MGLGCPEVPGKKQKRKECSKTYKTMKKVKEKQKPIERTNGQSWTDLSNKYNTTIKH